MKFDKSKQPEKCNNVTFFTVDKNQQLKTCLTIHDCIKEKYYEQYYCPFLVRKLV